MALYQTIENVSLYCNDTWAVRKLETLVAFDPDAISRDNDTGMSYIEQTYHEVRMSICNAPEAIIETIKTWLNSNSRYKEYSIKYHIDELKSDSITIAVAVVIEN